MTGASFFSSVDLPFLLALKISSFRRELSLPSLAHRCLSCLLRIERVALPSSWCFSRSTWPCHGSGTKDKVSLVGSVGISGLHSPLPVLLFSPVMEGRSPGQSPCGKKIKPFSPFAITVLQGRVVRQFFFFPPSQTKTTDIGNVTFLPFPFFFTLGWH